jgi:hypothetical protein
MSKKITLAEMLRAEYATMNKLERLEFEKLLGERLPGLVVKASKDARKNKKQGEHNYDNKNVR